MNEGEPSGPFVSKPCCGDQEADPLAIVATMIGLPSEVMRDLLREFKEQEALLDPEGESSSHPKTNKQGQ